MTAPTGGAGEAGPVDVLVVAVMYNSEPLLEGLIGSLAPGLEGLSWHLVLVDNASSDGSVAAARRLAPAATVVETGRNGGYAAGINAGVAAGPAFGALLILNPDVRLGQKCVATLREALDLPGTGLAVPKLVDGDGDLIHTMRREPSVVRVLADAFVGARRAGRSRAGEMVTDETLYLTPAVVDWAEGSTLLVSAECWARCAPWDESFFLYSEETDFALRARDAGLVTRYVPDARAVHLEGDSRVSRGLWTLVVLNKVRLFGRRHSRPHAVAFWAALLLREASRALIGKPTSRAAVAALVRPSRLRERPGPQVVARYR